MPLSDADIFRAQLYKLFAQDGKQSKDDFVKRRDTLQELCNKIFHPRKDTPVDHLFRRYMYYLLAKNEVKNDTFPDMRDYYEKNGYKVLQSEQTFNELETLANFWNDVFMRNEKFSPRVLRSLYILSWTPYSLWAYVVSIYFMGNRDLNEEKFCAFLDKVTAMILMNAILDLGKQNIRRPFVLEFKDIFRGESLNFDAQFKPQEKILRRRLEETKFSSGKAVLTRAMLAWWTFRNPAQDLPPINTKLEIEHIYAKNRCNFEPLQNPDALEFLGNKTLLEKRINIGAADYRFVDKKKFYLGWQPKGKKYQHGTFNLELRDLAETHNDFMEADLLARNEKIFDAFISYLRGNDLMI